MSTTCSLEAKEAFQSHRLQNHKRRRKTKIPILTVSALLVSIVLYLWVAFQKKSPSETAALAESTSESTTGSATVDSNKDPLESSTAETTPLEESTLSASCDYDCQTDRGGHNTLFSKGQALCNHQYRFGLNQEGVFQWQDCDTNEIRVVYNATGAARAMQMTDKGTFEVYSDAAGSSLIWSKPSNRFIEVTKECLHPHPTLDCPYLHLHKSGDVVLNWIDKEKNQWMARNILRCYEDLFL